MTQSLPATAYIKKIDVWMICMILYPFFVVSLYTIKEVLEKNQNKTNNKEISGDWIVKKDIRKTKTLKTVTFLLDLGLPLLVSLSVTVFWFLGLANYAYSDVVSVC